MKRHQLDPVSLVCGLLALAGCGAWFVWDNGVLSTSGLALATPIALIAVGVIGVVASLLRAAPHGDSGQVADRGDDQNQYHDTNRENESS